MSGLHADAADQFAEAQTGERAAQQPVRLASLGPEAPAGTFSDFDGPFNWLVASDVTAIPAPQTATTLPSAQ